MRIVGFVPARSGSKGLHNKNIKLLNRKPLMAWSIDAAKECPLIDDVYVSSDSSEYLEIAKKYGAITIERDPELAKDTTSIKEVIMGTPEILEADAIVLLYPVYPLRTADDMTKYVQTFIDLGGERALTSAVPPKTHPYLCYKNIDNKNPQYVHRFFDAPQHIFEPRIDKRLLHRRQDYDEYWEITLWAAIAPTKLLPELNNQLINWNTHFYKLPDPIKGSDIDTQEQFDFVEYLMTTTKYKDEFSICGHSHCRLMFCKECCYCGEVIK